MNVTSQVFVLKQKYWTDTDFELMMVLHEKSIEIF